MRSNQALAKLEHLPDAKDPGMIGWAVYARSYFEIRFTIKANIFEYLSAIT